MFQVEIDGRVLGEGVGSTWDEARMQVKQLNPSLGFCFDLVVPFV